MNRALNQDKTRYHENKVFRFQRLFRRYQNTNNNGMKLLYKTLYHFAAKKNHIDISLETQIKGGLFIAHPYCISINRQAIIGYNCNIHKGVTIGQENRGERKGAPTIGNSVWIGINSTVVGNITIGNDVMIAPNTFVNRDVPDHSVVLGNPCIIKPKENATENYINRKCTEE